MRIGVYLGQYIPPEEGGGAVFQNEVLEELINQNKSHELYIYYFGKIKPKANSSKVTLIQLSSKSLRRFIKRIFNLIKDQISFSLHDVKETYSFLNDLFIRDEIQFAYFPTPSCFAETEVPFIFTMWDLGDKVHPYFPETSIKNRNFELRNTYYSRILPKATYIFIGNETGKNQLIKYYHIGENRIIKNPMITPNYIYTLKADNEVLKKFDIQKNKYFFYPAQFWPHKNHIRILLAMQELSKRGYKLVLTGSDKGNLGYIRQKTEEFNLCESVIFTGFVSQEEIIALYKNAFALCYASIMGPDNIPPLEAMGLECPVICSKYDGAVEQLEDAAIFFNPYDEKEIINAVLQLENYDLRKQLISKGSFLAKKYSIKNYIDVVLKTFDKASEIRECWK